MHKEFRKWIDVTLTYWPGGPSLDRDRWREYSEFADKVAARLSAGASVWAELPGLVHEAFGHRGWNWNGFYVRDGDALQLGVFAAQPGVMVCATLPREPDAELHESGMCWDGIVMNQALYAAHVKCWPGYVSCDGESGLKTFAGLVCPVRGGQASPIAVWDLDAEEPLYGTDPLFMERLITCLDVLTTPGPEDLQG